MKSWQKRWFVLDYVNQYFAYFETIEVSAPHFHGTFKLCSLFSIFSHGTVLKESSLLIKLPKFSNHPNAITLSTTSSKCRLQDGHFTSKLPRLFPWRSGWSVSVFLPLPFHLTIPDSASYTLVSKFVLESIITTIAKHLMTQSTTPTCGLSFLSFSICVYYHLLPPKNPVAVTKKLPHLKHNDHYHTIQLCHTVTLYITPSSCCCYYCHYFSMCFIIILL